MISILGQGTRLYDGITRRELMRVGGLSLLKEVNLPVLDAAYPALVEDLDNRGVLDATLVIVMGEMGRTPRVGKNRSFADESGRDHWPQCGFSLLTGGGVKAGMVFGASDRIGAYPKDNPVSPADVVATIYHLLGIDPHMMVHDQTAGRIQLRTAGSRSEELSPSLGRSPRTALA